MWVAGLQQHGALAVIKDHPGDRARFRLHHRFADDRESFFADLVAGH
jgi:hypothetical protein